MELKLSQAQNGKGSKSLSGYSVKYHRLSIEGKSWIKEKSLSLGLDIVNGSWYCYWIEVLSREDN